VEQDIGLMLRSQPGRCASRRIPLHARRRQQHCRPLSEAALAILHQMAALKGGSRLVFLGQRKGALTSDMTLTVNELYQLPRPTTNLVGERTSGNLTP